jgi:hypothetical protein
MRCVLAVLDFRAVDDIHAWRLARQLADRLKRFGPPRH